MKSGAIQKSPQRVVNGLLLLDKPVGISSNHALQRVKRFYQAKKAGHSGNLDPLASGMLPICLGEATKFSRFWLNADKEYVADIQFGSATSTGDLEGEVVATRPIPPLSLTMVQSVLKTFLGNSEQIPPMYSALKYNGQPLYKLARQGILINRKKRQIYIKTLQLLNLSESSLRIQVLCSKGTYIRTLAEDIAKALGTFGYLKALRRSIVYPFYSHSMYTLSQLEQLLDETAKDTLLLSIDAGLQHLPFLELSCADCQALQYGQIVHYPYFTDLTATIYRLYNSQKDFIGIGKISPPNCLLVERLCQTQ